MKRSYWGVIAAVVLAAPAYADGDRHDDHRDRDHFSRGGLEFTAILSGAQEVPGNDSNGRARATVKFDAAFTRVWVDVRVRGLTGSFTAAHFHCNRAGASGPPKLGLQGPGPLMFDGERLRGVLTNEHILGTDCESVVGRPINNLVSLALAMRDGLIYLNVHSDLYPPGEVRGQMLEAHHD